MSIYRALVVFFVINLCLFPARAQSTGAIEGTVIDAETQVPLPGVNVSVEGTQRGAATDTEGVFVIEDVPAGTHTLRAQFVGYRMERQSVEVPAGGTAEVRLALEPEAVQLSGIEVSALRPDLQPEGQLEATDVREANPRDSGELMRNLAGVEAVRRGPVGLDPVVRGLRETEVGVYLDGTRIFPGGPARMDSPLSHLDPSAIESIEVVKGPYALTWGAGNLGAVRVDTYDPWEAPSGLLHGRLQSGYDTNFGALEEAASLYGRRDAFSYQLHGAWRNGNDYETGDGTAIPGDFRSWEVRGKGGYRLSPDSRLTLAAGYQDQQNIDYPGRLLNADYFHTYNLSARYRLEREEGLLRSLEALAYVNDVSHGMDNDGKPTAEPDTSRMPPFPLEVAVDADVTVTGGRLAAELAPETGWRLEVGGDLYSARREATRRIWRNDENRQLLFTDLMWPGARITDAGLFARGERSFPSGFRVAGTLRADLVRADADTASTFFQENTASDLSSTELNLSGALTTSYAPSEHWSLSLGLGSVVRTADATERYSDRIPASKAQTSAEFVGTPGLAPERSTQADLWIEATYPRVAFSFNAFARRITDYITLAPTDLPKRLPLSPETVYRYRSGTASFWGAESRLAYALTPALTAKARASYLRGRDETLDEPALGVAPPRLSTGLRYEPEGGRFFAEGLVHLVDRQERVATTRGELPTEGHATVNLKGGVDLTRRASVQIGVTNLFDVHYVNHLNAKNPFTGQPLPEPGRVFFADVTFSF